MISEGPLRYAYPRERWRAPGSRPRRRTRSLRSPLPRHGRVLEGRPRGRRSCGEDVNLPSQVTPRPSCLPACPPLAGAAGESRPPNVPTTPRPSGGAQGSSTSPARSRREGTSTACLHFWWLLGLRARVAAPPALGPTPLYLGPGRGRRRCTWAVSPTTRSSLRGPRRPVRRGRFERDRFARLERPGFRGPKTNRTLTGAPPAPAFSVRAALAGHDRPSSLMGLRPVESPPAPSPAFLNSLIAPLRRRGTLTP